MLISEILDKPAPLQWGHETERKLYAIAEIAGRKIKFQLDRWPSEIDLDDKKVMPWNFSFVEIDDDHRDGETYDATGNGGEYKVFATAKEFLIGAIDRASPDVIHFEANKSKSQSRARLYKHFVSRWQPPGYKYREVTSNEDADYHAFVKI